MRDNIEWHLVEILEGGIRKAQIFDTDMNDEEIEDNVLWDDQSVLKHPNIQATREKYWQRFIKELKDQNAQKKVEAQMSDLALKQEDIPMDDADNESP